MLTTVRFAVPAYGVGIELYRKGGERMKKIGALFIALAVAFSAYLVDVRLNGNGEATIEVASEANAFIRRIGRAFRRLGRRIKRGIRRIGRGIKKGIRKIGKGIKKVAKKIGKGIKKGIKKIGKGIK